MTNAQKLIFIFLVFHFQAICQKQFTGRIVDYETKKPLKDVTVKIKGKEITARSNGAGFFQVHVDTSDYMIFEKSFYDAGLVKVPSTDAAQFAMNKKVEPEYSEGVNGFYKFLGKNAIYPAHARRTGTEGRVYISFVVDSLGQISNVKIIKDVGYDCGDELVKLLKRIPGNWTPTEKPFTFILPVTFRLGDSKIKPEQINLPPGKLIQELVITAYGSSEPH
jgi:TonB family protein